MRRTTTTICNKLGLHARAAAKLVQTASSFDCEIKLVKDDKEVNGKSIMGVMMLAANLGTEITITVKGADEEKAMEALVGLFESKFGEQQ